ncbi:MAG: MFS transporter [Blastocatellia bacterium]
MNWRHPDFLKLWAGQTISLFGSQITALALPLTAVLTLQATPAQMGMLRATHSASAVMAGLFAGVLADRVRRRPILIGTDLGFAVLAGSIPVAAFLGLLRIEQLYLVQCFSGILAVLSDVTHMAFLPSLARRHQLVEANSKLQTTSSAASIAGPGLAGVLTQLITAPIAIIFDAISFLISALFIWLIRAPEPPPAPVANRKSIRAEIGEGLRFVFGNPTLRPLAEAIAIHFLFNGLIYSVLILYASRELKIESAMLGVIFAAFGLGLLTGALAAERAARRYGVGPAMLGAMFTTAVAALLIPIADGPIPVTVAVLAFALFLQAFGIQINGINLVSLRQAMTPTQLQGRMNATFRFLNLIAVTIGALLAGVFSEVIGLRLTLVIGACGLFIPFLRLLLSPARNLQKA